MSIQAPVGYMMVINAVFGKLPSEETLLLYVYIYLIVMTTLFAYLILRSMEMLEIEVFRCCFFFKDFINFSLVSCNEFGFSRCCIRMVLIKIFRSNTTSALFKQLKTVSRYRFLW